MNKTTIGIAADHGGYHLKKTLITALCEWGYEFRDFGAYEYVADDDYPDFVIPLAHAVGNREIQRGIAICGSGIGACICANKIPAVRASFVSDMYSAHQGVEDDNMNVICIGAKVVGYELILDLLGIFLNARFNGQQRFLRRLAKVEALE